MNSPLSRPSGPRSTTSNAIPATSNHQQRHPSNQQPPAQQPPATPSQQSAATTSNHQQHHPSNQQPPEGADEVSQVSAPGTRLGRRGGSHGGLRWYYDTRHGSGCCDDRCGRGWVLVGSGVFGAMVADEVSQVSAPGTRLGRRGGSMLGRMVTVQSHVVKTCQNFFLFFVSSKFFSSNQEVPLNLVKLSSRTLHDESRRASETNATFPCCGFHTKARMGLCRRSGVFGAMVADEVMQVSAPGTHLGRRGGSMLGRMVVFDGTTTPAMGLGAGDGRCGRG